MWVQLLGEQVADPSCFGTYSVWVRHTQQSPILHLNVKNEFMCGTRTSKVDQSYALCANVF